MSARKEDAPRIGSESHSTFTGRTLKAPLEPLKPLWIILTTSLIGESLQDELPIQLHSCPAP